MVHSAIADENLLQYIQQLVAKDTCTVGLVLGQPSDQKDYIIHFAKTLPSEDESTADGKRKHIKSITDISELWVGDHAKSTTRMLPGGMYVLGIFAVSQEDLLTPFSNKFKSILNQVDKQLNSNVYLYGNGGRSEKLILNYCAKTHSYSCKSYDTASGSVKPAEVKFLPKPVRWKQFRCKYELNQVYSIPEDKVELSLKRQMNDIMDNITESLNKAVFAFNGEIQPDDVVIEVFDKKKPHKNHHHHHHEEKPVDVSIFLPCDGKDPTKPVQISDCAGHVKLTGQVAGNVWSHSKALVREVRAAVREDLVRSMAARLDMHWDSLIEEEHGSPEDTSSVHEPPRRVLVQLPDAPVALSDYLFPGEGPQDSQQSVRELLDVTIDEKDSIYDIEGQADLMDIYSCSVESDQNIDKRKSSVVVDANRFMYTVGIGVALLVLAISIVVHYFRFTP